MFVTSLGESVVCSAMVVTLFSAHYNYTHKAPLMSDAKKNEGGAFDWCGGVAI